MEIQVSINELNEEGEHEITFKFIKENVDNHDFFLRLWRLNNEHSLNAIIWAMFRISEGKEISARAWSDEELKTLSENNDFYKKKQIKDQKILTGMMMLIGLVLVASPILDASHLSPLNFWMATSGYIIIIGSAIAYAMIGWESKKKDKKL